LPSIFFSWLLARVEAFLKKSQRTCCEERRTNEWRIESSNRRCTDSSLY
jgi:hypothetical protein